MKRLVKRLARLGPSALFVMSVNHLVSLTNRTARVGRAALRRLTPRRFRRAKGARCYLRPGVSVEQFFSALKSREVSYVVLRWFEMLPNVAPGEDIDLLVADEHLERLQDLTSAWPTGQALDIYSVLGGAGHNFRNVPYYPPHRAALMLAERVERNGIFVPNERDHFLSLAYHAVMHKGPASGIPSKRTDCSNPNPEHDYSRILRDLAGPAGYDPDDCTAFPRLLALLRREGWAPELDTMRILARFNEWLVDEVVRTRSESEGELVVFIVREWARTHGKVDWIVDWLRRARFDVLLVHELTPDQAKRARSMARGGKWDRGPYPVDGGAPAFVIACFDYHPRPATERSRRTHPFVVNRNVLLKHALRDEINNKMFWFRHANSIHSADDEHEAWDYLSHVLPDVSSSLQHAVTLRRDTYRTDFPVLHVYEAKGTRAKIEKIEYRGRTAVKKTFKVGYERFCAREAFVYEHFSKHSPLIPPLLEAKENYVIIPWYRDLLHGASQRSRREMIASHADDIIGAMRMFYEHGYALIGFYEGNVLVTDEGVRLIDFEFLYKYATKPGRFSESYDIAGIPPDFDGDLPRGVGKQGHTYANTWHRILGPLPDEA